MKEVSQSPWNRLGSGFDWVGAGLDSGTGLTINAKREEGVIYDGVVEECPYRYETPSSTQ